MLVIDTFRAVDATVEVAVDEYLPLAVRTSPSPLAVSYYTVGDRLTSLFEIQIERVSRLVRAVVLVSFPNVGGRYEPTQVPIVEGLPVVAAGSMPEFRTHAAAALNIRLGTDTVAIDWSAGAPIDMVIRQGRLWFLIGRNELLGAVVADLSTRDVEQLREHARRHGAVASD